MMGVCRCLTVVWLLEVEDCLAALQEFRLGSCLPTLHHWYRTSTDYFLSIVISFIEYLFQYSWKTDPFELPVSCQLPTATSLLPH